MRIFSLFPSHEAKQIYMLGVFLCGVTAVEVFRMFAKQARQATWEEINYDAYAQLEW